MMLWISSLCDQPANQKFCMADVPDLVQPAVMLNALSYTKWRIGPYARSFCSCRALVPDHVQPALMLNALSHSKWRIGPYARSFCSRRAFATMTRIENGILCDSVPALPHRGNGDMPLIPEETESMGAK